MPHARTSCMASGGSRPRHAPPVSTRSGRSFPPLDRTSVGQVTKTEGLTDRGYRAVPPLDPALCAVFGVKPGLSDRCPTPAAFKKATSPCLPGPPNSIAGCGEWPAKASGSGLMGRCPAPRAPAITGRGRNVRQRDAFAHRPWPNTLLYTIPPVPLIPQVLDRVQEERLYMILIAPQRTSAPWFPCLQCLLSGPPKELPCRRDALSQAGGAIIDYSEIGQRLCAWPLNAISPISCAPYARLPVM
jgi:hypothetical protein